MGFAQNGDYLDVNNVRAFINPNGILFQDSSGNAGFQVPKTTPYDSTTATHTIFSQATWLTATDSATNSLFTSGSDPYNYLVDSLNSKDFSFGPIASDYTTTTYQNRYNRVWKVSQKMIANHIVNVGSWGYIIPDAILSWPAHGTITNGECRNLANYVDVDFDNIYNPFAGDYPSIRGDESILLIFNDEATNQQQTGGNALKLEIYALVYGYDTGSDPIDNTVFVNYRVINRSWNTYKDVYFGSHTDFDIGCFDNDFVGCDSTNNFYYGYNGTASDGPACRPRGFGNSSNLPIQSCIFLNQKMEHFVYYHNDWSLTGNPETNSDYDNYLKGIWKDGVPITYGGNGRGGLTPTNYMYSGDPGNFSASSWSECNSNGGSPNTAADRRGLGSTKINRLAPQESFCVDLAFMFDSAYALCSSISGYVGMVNQVQSFYASQSNTCLTEGCGNLLSTSNINSTSLHFQCFPNPASDVVYINSSQKMESGELKIFDISGKMVLQKEVSKLDGENIEIDISNLGAGTYLIQVSNDGRLGSQKLIVH